MDMKLDSIYYNYIKNKEKIYETRIFDEKRQKLKLLDVVTFYEKETKNSFKARITELSFFKNFKDAIQPVSIKKVLPNAKSLKEGVEIYNKFPHGEGGTFKDAAKKYGVLRMKFDLL